MFKYFLIIILLYSSPVLAKCDTLFPNKEPVIKDTIIICNSFFATVYDIKNNTPIYSSEIYQKPQVIPRAKKFTTDIRLPTIIRTQYYIKSGYDRGHLTPANNAINSEQSSETFLLSNISPQVPELNRGEWRTIEEAITKESKYTYILTGVGFNNYNNKIKNLIPIPDYFWKVVFYENNKCRAFVAENNKINRVFDINIIELENKTKLNLRNGKC